MRCITRHYGLSCILLLASLLAAVAYAYDYRYIEGEQHTAGEGVALRQQGFTSWMGHPSRGAVVTLGAPGNWVSYKVRNLSAEPYHVFIRGLAWRTGCEVNVFWDGQPVGRPRYPDDVTALRWSQRVGLVRGPGEHELRVVRAPGSTQAPYIDVVLLTTQPGLIPDDADQDFEDMDTPLPVLRHSRGNVTMETVCPDRRTPPPLKPNVEVISLAMPFPRLGINPLLIWVRSDAADKQRVTIDAGFRDADTVSTQVLLYSRKVEAVFLNCIAPRVEKTRLDVKIRSADRDILAGSYAVDVRPPATITLDQYAYPVGTPLAAWKASFTIDNKVQDTTVLASECAARLELTVDEDVKVLQDTQADSLGVENSYTFQIGKLKRGRYAITTAFNWRGSPAWTDHHEFILYEPATAEPWEPATRTAATATALTLNGRPFLGRLLYHAPADIAVRQQGFNLVQVWGDDPDPTVGIGKQLDACKASGLWATVALFNTRSFLTNRTFDADRVCNTVRQFMNHPAVFAWDLADEPDAAEIPPQQVAEVAAKIRATDPNHIVWVNLCRLDTAGAYLEAQDLWSYDTYPIPTPGLAGYAKWLEFSDANLCGRKPLGTSLQTYLYALKPGTRMPTPDELRASLYLHIIHGYKWFGFYSYSDPEPSGCLRRDPVLWSATRGLNHEILTLAPIILDPAPYTPVDTGLSPGLFEASVKAHDGKRWLFAVNLTGQPQEPSLAVKGSAAHVQYEAVRTVPISGDLLRDTFLPHGARLYLLAD